MTVPSKYADTYLPVKYFLNSYRALSDGRRAIGMLEKHVEESSLLLSDWKIHWIAGCTLLRSAIDLFKQDQFSCMDKRIREEFKSEWNTIGNNREEHSIFWNFLKKERDSIIHQYEWPAYEVWLDDRSNSHRPARMSIADLRLEGERNALLMRSGMYKGRDSVELLNESALWVECRIQAAVERAGYSLDEERNLVNFSKRPKIDMSLLGI